MIDPEILSTIKAEWKSAPRGSKTIIIKKWAGLTGASYQALYRRLGVGVKRMGTRQIPDIEAQAAFVAAIKKRPPSHRGEIATEDAVAIARHAGCDILASCSHIDRVIRDIGAQRAPRRVVRWQAEFPNQLHHVDGSTSNCFYVARKEDGDCVLKLYKGYQGYKNKPIPIGLRPWIYGLVDDYSGVHMARYVAAEGESMADCLDFLCWCWAKTEDKPFFGLPAFLKADHGPLMKSDDAVRFLLRLGVAIDPSTPGNKEAHGKIERPWRTLWQRFELPFWAEDPASFEIPMSELNARLLNYLAAYNQKGHRFDRTLTRISAWSRINQRGGAVALAPDAIRKMVRRYERTVAQDGTFGLNGDVYEVKGLHSAKVRVWEGIADGRLVVESIRTGERFAAGRFEPLGFSEFKASPETGDQAARKAAGALDIVNPLHTAPPEPERVLFPVRVAGTADAPDMGMDRYRDLETAMADFVALTGIAPDDEDRAALSRLIEDNGLSRAFVREIAAEALMADAV